MIYVSQEIILAAFLVWRARRGKWGRLMKSPDGANARGAFDCCMVENSGVSCCGETEVLFYGASVKPWRGKYGFAIFGGRMA